MLSFLVFCMIFVGVTISLYQVYDVHYNLNFDDEEQRPHALNKELKELSDKANEYSETGSPHNFMQAVNHIFGHGFDHRVVLAALTGERRHAYAEPLLRRKNNVVLNGRLKILHLPFWKTNPPTKSVRGILLTFILVNSLLALFWGAMSVYTVAYEVSISQLSWLNDEAILMALVYFSILLTYLASKLDSYMHDIYQVGKLNSIVFTDPENR
ncbi:hypothetical protein MHM84_09985 [Halomonas sp. McH1-25]|uniref:hypothetical protein n=1 Tax=unclassified Halomonas TaxID=2609666 RepID=UPI001EF4A5CE|nr:MULTISPECIES: hypothetical protein [unclassified Halomonas]MCG7600118.1 hypothetical protein [Halomonas sp. McH1-25]MCP1341367.1 hypothetical protein [Halomonas sp. FL8]MCP1359688.1 hypothetical protein [Halomonas sp. BBD45]MCP1364260.1 hypothetical protein [Halomonas sp. BBD48]